MAKRDFDAFYYGVGMKIDDRSIDQAAEKVEGRLNQVVENVTKEFKKIANAVNSGVKDIDTRGLATALKDVGDNLDEIVDFDPKKLKTQIGQLESQFGSLETKIDGLADSVRDSLSDVTKLIDGVSTRLSNIEIVAPKMGKDALKKDVKEISSIADLARQALTNGLTVPDEVMRSLDRKLTKLRQGFHSIEQSGNSLTLFTDGGLAKDLVQLVETLGSIGAPVEGVLDGVVELTSKMKDSFKSNGIAEFTQNITYQIEELNYEIRNSKKDLEEYEARLNALPKKTIGIAVLKGTKDDTLLDQFDNAEDTEKALAAIIERIKEYRIAVKTLKGEDKLNAYRDLVALTEATEKRLRGAKTQNLNDLWSDNFSKDFDRDTNKLSSTLGHQYEEALSKVRESIRDNIKAIKYDIENALEDIDTLLAKAGKEKKTTKPGRPQGTTNKTKKETKTTEVAKVTGEQFVVSPKLNIDANEWAKTINDTLTKIENEEKIRGIKLRVDTSSAKIIKDLNTIRTQIQTSLAGKDVKESRGSDNVINEYVKAFNKSLENFRKNLEKNKNTVKDMVKDWRTELKEAFKFNLTIDGMNKQNIKTEVGSYVTTYINAINDVAEINPLKFTSNIDALIEEIKTKTAEIEIDSKVNIKAGDVSIPQQTIGDLNLVIDTNGLAQDATVEKIYRLLSVGNGGDASARDARIAELERLIAEAEGSERKTLGVVEAKAIAEQKGAEAVERKVEVENQPKAPPTPPTPPSAPASKATSSIGKDEAVQIVKAAIGEFRGRSDASKASAYNSLSDKVLEAGDIMHENLASLNKAELALHNKLLGMMEASERESLRLAQEGTKESAKQLENEQKKTEETKEAASSGNKKSSNTKANEAKPAEEMKADRLREGRSIVEFSLKLAKWAKALRPLSEELDYTITEKDFGDEDTFTRDGVVYTRENLKKHHGSILVKGDIEKALNEFIAEYENSEDEEFKELFGFFQKMVEAYRSNQTNLIALLKELDGTDIAQKYNSATDKSEYLSRGIKSSFGRAMAKNGNKDAQANIIEILSRHGVLDKFNKLSTEKDSKSIQQIVKDIANSGNFDKLVSDLASVEGSMGKSYDSLVNFLKIFKEFNLSTETLNEIGIQAQKWIRGTKVEVDKYKKVYNEKTRKVEYTDEVIGVKPQVIEDGIRQYLKRVAVVFVDEIGNYIYGFNAGKNVSENFLSGRDSFTKIVNVLTQALERAAEIRIPTKKGEFQGYEGLENYELPDPTKDKPTYKAGTIKSGSESQTVAKQIANLQGQKQIAENGLNNLRQELALTVSDAENVAKILELSNQKDEKRQSVKAQENKIDDIRRDIGILERQLANPAESFESIATRLLQKQEALKELQKKFGEMPNKTSADKEAIEKVKEQIKKENEEITRLQSQARDAKRDYNKKVALDLIDQESLNVESLEKVLSEKEANSDIKSKRDEAATLKTQREGLRDKLVQLRAERNNIVQNLSAEQEKKIQENNNLIQTYSEDFKKETELIKNLENKKDPAQKALAIKRRDTLAQRLAELRAENDAITKNPAGGYTTEQESERQKKQTEIDELTKQINEIVAREDVLSRDITSYDREIAFLTGVIDVKKKYITSLQNGLTNRAVMSTSDELQTKLDAKMQELSQAQAEQTRLQSEYSTLQGSENDIVNRELESLRTLRTQKEARLKEIDATKDVANNAQLQTERSALEAEIAQIDKHISEGLVETIIRIHNEMEATQQSLEAANRGLANRKTDLKTASDSNVYYADGKPIDEARAKHLLPDAEAAKRYAEGLLKRIEEDYSNSMYAAVAQSMEEKAAGTRTPADHTALMNAIKEESEAKASFKAGKITEEEYLTKLSNAYIAFGNIEKTVAKENAQRIVEARKEIAILEREIAILKNIAGGGDGGAITPKPIEVPKKTAEPKATQQRATEKAKTTEVKTQKKEEQQKTTETKEQKKNEEAKSAEGEKQVKLAQQQTTEAQKRVETTQKQNVVKQEDDIVLGASGKSADEFWKAFRMMAQEVAEGKRVFREYGFDMRGKHVSNVGRGLYSSTSMQTDMSADAHGHFHPRNSMYSMSDINSIVSRRQKNSNYNTDYLFTPDYVHSLTGLKNASVKALEELQAKWESIGNMPLDMDVKKLLQESWLAKFAQNNNGVRYNKQQINADGTKTDISNSIVMFEEDVEKQILQWGETRKRMTKMMRDGLSGTKEYDELRVLAETQYKQLMQNQAFASVAPQWSDLNANKGKINALTDKSHAATLIQEAVDYDLDLSFFVEQFETFFKSMKHLEEVIPEGSPLAKISEYIKQIKGADEAQRKVLIEELKPYVLEVFKKNSNAKIDVRDEDSAKVLREASANSPYRDVIEKQIKEQLEKRSAIASEDDEIVGETRKTVDELKAELARLKAERDSEGVSPRFATVEKQQEIIELLKAGIKVNGKLTTEKAENKGDSEKDEKPAKETKKKTPKIPTVGKVDVQSAEIKLLEDNIDKNWDVYKNYQASKEQLSRAIESAKAKGNEFTSEDADNIRALRDQVLSFGKDVIKASEAMGDLKARSQDATNGIKMGVVDVREDMLQLAQDRAIADKSLITDVSFDEAKQRMTAVLTDMNGQTTRLTMNYYEMFDAIVTSSDKTTDSVRKVYKTIEGEMTKMVEIGNLTNDTFGKPILKKSKEYEDYADAFTKMQEAANAIRAKGTLATKEEKDELISLVKQVGVTRAAFEKLAQASAEFDKKVEGDTGKLTNPSNLEAEMKAYVLNSHEWTKSQRSMIEETWKFNAAQKTAAYSVEKNKGQLASMSVVADMGTKKIGQFTAETKAYKSGMEKFMDSLKNKWQEVARYLMTFGSLYRVFGMLKQGLQYVKEIDSALTELKKVTDEAEESYDRFLKTAAKTADKVGSTIKEIVSSTADWARIGYSLEDATTLAESTAILLNVSEFRSIDEATSALTSTLQAFSYTAEQSMDVVNVLNEVGNNFAVSSDGIATALKDSASSLVAANNSYEEAVALIASANRVVQDPGSVGAALRTISLRLRGTSTKELEEAGEDTTGVVESKSKLRTKIQGYTGVDILTDTGAYKSTYEILLEISKVWDDLTDQDRAGLLEMIAGKTRSNTAAAILSNGEDLRDALAAAQDAEGSALRENEKYLDSIQGKIDQFNNAVQTMWANILDDEWVKRIVEIGTFLVEFIDNLGVIKTLLTVIGAGVIQKYFKGDLFGGLFGDKSSIESVKKGITDLEEAYTRAQAKFNSSKSTEDRKAMEDAKANLDAFKEANKPILDAEEHKTALNEQLEKLKAEREQLRGDLQTAQDNLVDITTNGVQEDVREFVEIDTSHIDNQIAGVQEKLDIAKQELSDAKSATWDDYKALGSTTPAKDRDNRINDKKKEIKDLEAELDNLQVKKDEFMSTKIDNVVSEGAKAQVEDLTNKIGDTDKAIQQTELELQKVEAQANATGNAGLTAGQKFKTGFNGAKAAIKKFGKEMLKSMAWSMAIAAVFEAVGTIGTWISDAFKAADTSAEALQDKFEELDSELSAIESELRNLRSELEDTDERIEELMSQGSLTFVEQEELNKLKSVSAELKAQIGLQENLRKSKQRGVNSASIDATNAYLDTSFMSDKSKTERQEESKEKWSSGLQVVGTVAGAIIGSIIAPGIGTAIGTAIGSTIGDFGGGLIGEAVAGVVYDSEQSVGEALDNMLVERNNLLQKQKDALAKNDAEAYNEATKALRTYDAQMSKHISQIQQNYNAMDWETASPEDRKEMMEYADWLDKYNISMGTVGAKSNAVNRIFGDEASDELKAIKIKIEEVVKTGENFVLQDILTEEEYQAVLTRISNIGVGVGDVASYFEHTYKTEVEAMNDTSTESAVKEVANLTSGVKALKEAFNELHTEGKVSFDTLIGLKDTFGDLDSWSDFITTMSTGTATMDQMTESARILAEEFISDKISPSGLINPDEYLTYINGLESLGVTNAKDFFNAKLQEKAVEAFVNGTYETIEEAEAAFSSDDYQIKITDDLLTAAQNKKNADGKVKNTIDAYNTYEDQKIAQDNAQGNVDAYNAYLATLKKMGLNTENIANAFKNSLSAQGIFDSALLPSQMSDEFKTLYENAKQAYKDGNSELLQEYLTNLAEYGVHTENIGNAFNNNLGADQIWQNRLMTPEFEKAYNEAKQLYQQGLDIPEVTVEVVTELDVSNVKSEAKVAEDAYKAALKDIGLEIDIKLVDVNVLIDDLQSAYDTLSSAAKEYAENGGYVSVDTLQTLLGLEPKYIGLLYNEQDQLELNTESIQRMTQARIMEMAILQAKSYLTDLENAAIDGNVEKLAALTEATYIATDAEWSFVDSQLASIKTKMMDKGMSESEATTYINNARHNIESMQKLAKTTASNISNTISSSGNTATQEANDAFKDAMDYWENRIGAAESRFEQIQHEIDMLEAQGKKAGAGYYQEQIKQLQEFGEEGNLVGGKLYLLNEQLAEAQAMLSDPNIKEGSDEWWEIANTINDIEAEIDDVTLSIQDLKDAMADTHWYIFDEAHDRISTLASDLENIRDILSNEKLFDDEGNFTEEGLGTLATYVQELGVFEGALANAKAEMELFGDSYDPNKKYVDLQGNDLSIDSEQDWYDAAEKAEEKYDEWNNKVIETRYNIKELYEQQIDAVEEYTQTLVENYNEYIDAVKEALDSERDLYEFKKSTEQKSKNMAALERRIASLSGSTNASDVAERRKLQAELMDAKSDMDDHYYSHSKEQQSQALDDEMTAYETAMNAYIEGLRTKLEESTAALYMSYEEMGAETKNFIDGVTQSVILNAGNVESVYKSTGESIDQALVTPWTNAAAKIGWFASSDEALGMLNTWTEHKSGAIFYDFQTKASQYLQAPWTSTNLTSAVSGFQTSLRTTITNIVSDVNENVSNIISHLQTEIDKIKDTDIRINVDYEATGDGSGGGGNPKVTVHTGQGGGGRVGFAEITMYAKGTTGTTRDQWAITDEPQFGDELVLVPGKDGNLSFMRKGTGVVPADMTQKLFELAQIPTSDLMNKNLTAIVPNITKNDFKNEFNFESLVHVDTVDSDTLPKLEKMVDKKIDDFSKALNYSLKRFAR